MWDSLLTFQKILRHPIQCMISTYLRMTFHFMVWFRTSCWRLWILARNFNERVWASPVRIGLLMLEIHRPTSISPSISSNLAHILQWSFKLIDRWKAKTGAIIQIWGFHRRRSRLSLLESIIIKIELLFSTMLLHSYSTTRGYLVDWVDLSSLR